MVFKFDVIGILLFIDLFITLNNINILFVGKLNQ